MKSLSAAWTFAALLAMGPAWAQQENIVNGLIVDLGLMPAERAVQAEGHRHAHPATFPRGSQHVLVTLVAAKTHRRIGDATVVVTVRGPTGATEEKPLLHTRAVGLADYSELFVFGTAARYSLRVKITPAHGAKSTVTVFNVTHHI